MIPEPSDPDHEIPVAKTFPKQTDEELTEKEVIQMEADDQSIQIILMGLPEDIYAAVDSCEIAQEICQEKYLTGILKKFDFTTIKTASTLMEPNKALVKDAEAKDIDMHLYRSMIRSLMYLTAFRPDIIFVVYVCTRFQVTLKTSHPHAVKRIFRYLKGQPKLGLWYPNDSPFDLEAYYNRDYARASLDRKSTTGGCQFIGKRLISRQCKKQTIVANSTTEADRFSVLVTNRDETVYKEWEDRMERATTTASSLEAKEDSGNIYRTESMATLNEPLPQGTGSGSGPRCHDTILRGADAQTRSHLKLEDSDGISTLPNTEIFKQLALMGRRRAVSTGRGGVSTASRIISTAKETVSTAGVSMPDEEESQRIDKDAEMAHRLQEEIDAIERQRMAQVHQAAQTFIDDE
nr:putative ribonuclease H-like domain-containing protein [Tanacetum cinerariifolium]